MYLLEVLSNSPATAAPTFVMGAIPPQGELIAIVLVGLMAGALGGLLGIGGSIIMIPYLTLVPPFRDQHIAQAAAMIVNVFVATPAMAQHNRNNAVRWDAVGRALPAGLLFILIGVEMSNAMDASVLRRIFGAFLVYVVYINCMKLFSPDGEPEPHENLVNWWTCSFVGVVTGFMAGLLGIGGGVIIVPLLQRACRLPLRQCIASSAALMILTAVVGAARKNWALASLTGPDGDILHWQESVVVAACFIPTAIIGGWLGAKLTHQLKLTYVRVAFILLLTWAAWEMLGLIEVFGASAVTFE